MINDEYWEPPQGVTCKTYLDIYERNVDQRIIKTGKRIGSQTLGQAEASILIERLVNRIISGRQMPYAIRYRQDGFISLYETSLGKSLREAISVLGLFDSFHDYSEHLVAFLDACWGISGIYGINLWSTRRASFTPDIDYAEAMNDIVGSIRKRSTEQWFKRAASDRRWEAKDKARTIAKHTEDVLKYYASITNVRIDFSYLKDSRKKLTVDDFYEHLDQLLYLKDFHPLFRNLVGYAWHVEQGERKGFHVHFTFMFDGSEMSKGVNMGFALANLWDKEITQGVGATYICNANTGNYDKDKIGVGYMRRTDEKSCINAVTVNQYLAKDTQYLRIKPRGRRTFGTGISPDIAKKKGRPPKALPSW